MANHRTPDGAARHRDAFGCAVRAMDIPAPRATSVWTYGPPTPSVPLPRVADIAADVTAPAHRPRPLAPVTATMRPTSAPTTPHQAGPAHLPHARPVRSGSAADGITDLGISGAITDAACAPDPGTARRSDADEIAARATTTLIPSSPGARSSGPVFVDGSGRRARWFTGLAAAAATLAAGYVGVVVTGALAGSSGPAGPAVPVTSGASLAPASPVLGPPAPVVRPAEVTTTRPARPTTTTPTRTTRTTPRTAPRPVAPPVAPAPVPIQVPVPIPAPPVVPPPPAPAVPAAPAAPRATTPATPDGAGTTAPRRDRPGRPGDAAAPGPLST